MIQASRGCVQLIVLQGKSTTLTVLSTRLPTPLYRLVLSINILTFLPAISILFSRSFIHEQNMFPSPMIFWALNNTGNLDMPAPFTALGFSLLHIQSNFSFSPSIGVQTMRMKLDLSFYSVPGVLW